MPEINSFHIDVDTPVKASAERVFAALTNGISSWWGAPYFESAETKNIVLEPKIGGRLYEQWEYDRGDMEGSLLGTVVAINPPEYLRLEGSFGMHERVVHGLVTFRLKTKNSVTTICLKHSVLGEVDAELEERYTKGWTDLMSRLVDLVERAHSEGILQDPSLSI